MPAFQNNAPGKITRKVNEPAIRLGPKPKQNRSVHASAQSLKHAHHHELEESVRIVTSHFIQQGSTSLPKWQVENVVRNYFTNRQNVGRIEGTDYTLIEQLIRTKELGGLPGTNVKASPKGLSPERARSVASAHENSLDKKYVDISLKKSNVAKLPALK